MATTILFVLISSFLLISPALCSTNVLYSDLSSPNNWLVYGDYSFGLYGCNLALYANDTVVWETGDLFPPVVHCTLTLESDGELIVRGTEMAGTYIGWRSGVISTVGKYALVLKYDGTVHVYGPTVWSKPKPITIESSTGRSNLLSSSVVDSTFWTGDIAPIGTTIANGEYKLELHGSCNLTLSDGKTNETLWYSDTYDEYDLYDCFVSLGDNGELAIKYLGGAPLWTSGATGPGKSDYVLALRPDGNAAIYGPSIWFAGAMNKTGGRAVAVGSHAEKIAMVT